jgi:pimeloyl-ACP methyl ester carboxylesterase
VLILAFAAPGRSWAPGGFQVELAGHDQIWIDLRAYGRSEGAVACPDLAKYTGQIQTDTLTQTAIGALDACLEAGAASTVPLATSMDHAVVAADFVAVRKALGIDRWGLYSSASGANIVLNLIDVDEAAIESWFATSPQTVGHGWSPDNAAEAFERYAADCSRAPSCATNGDVAELFDAALAKLGDGLTTSVVEPGSGVQIVLDQPSLQGGVRFALGDPALSPLVPGLLAGIIDGSQVDTVASYYVTQPPTTTPLDASTSCQTRDFILPGYVDREETHAGQFTGMFTDSCNDHTGVPQFTAPPAVTSDLPVMVITTSYDSRSSDTNAKAITTGFSDVSRIFVPGIANAPRELTNCYLTVAADFLAGKPADTGCLTAPATSTLNPS